MDDRTAMLTEEMHPQVRMAKRDERSSFSVTTTADDRTEESLSPGTRVPGISTRCSSSSSSSFKWKWIVGILLCSVLVFVVIDSTVGAGSDGMSKHSSMVRSKLKDMLAWIQDHPVQGIFWYAATYAISVVLFLPASILTLGAGFVFCQTFGYTAGIIVGTLVAFGAASLGAMVAFGLGRYLFRDCCLRQEQEFLHQRSPMLHVLDKALHDHGLRIMVLLHLNPIVPFNALNYLAGITSVKAKDYGLALVAILPGTILYVCLGASAQNLAQLEDRDATKNNGTLTLILLCLGLLFGFLVVWQMAKYAKQELQQLEERYTLAEDNDDDDDDEAVDDGDNDVQQTERKSRSESTRTTAIEGNNKERLLSIV
eukprot:scaffold5072_cov72-Cylindrotheca_fusiformis.AAC.1